jgi:hypothetical protein
MIDRFLSACGESSMFKATGYREHAAECLRSAQTATPVRRAHLLRAAKVWLEIAEQTEHSVFSEVPEEVIPENGDGQAYCGA